MWCEGDLQLSNVLTKNVREDELSPRLGYAMVRLFNRHNTFQKWVAGYRRVLRTMCSE